MMFSFHKPKIYRSNLGCCICKAKSSSSRFTDSKKYENEFERCFRIHEKRSGEICNACVLLVKRWKKLSAENRLIKHWHHVVDARAGPGTKLTSGRRLTSSTQQSGSKSASGSSQQPNDSSTFSDSSSSSSSNSNSAQSSTGATSSGSSHHPLPLGSSQASNQVGNGPQGSKFSSSATGSGSQGNQSSQPVRRRGGSFSNKARAIDTNVSTFTFGEISRRNYMTPEGFSASACSSLAKPQSALNSSAFESVIKRFRQRQQQQLLEAQRRQLNRQQRQRILGQPNTSGNRKANAGGAGNTTTTINNNNNKKQLPIQEQQQLSPEKINSKNDLKRSSGGGEELQGSASKRIKRSSESIGSICVDGLRVSSLLDSSIWKKERVCCGIIFRGLYNEVAIFPKLLKPCQCRMQKKKPSSSSNQVSLHEQIDKVAAKEGQQQILTRQMLKGNSPSPPPRAQKSGSISSCDSNTSGTGSMEEPILDEELLAKESSSSSLDNYQEGSLKYIYI